MARPITIRQHILKSLMAIINENRDPLTNERVWNNIIKDNLIGTDMTQLPAIGVYEGDEETTDTMWPLLLKTLTVFIEFGFEREIGVDVYDSFNYYLGILQSTIFTDKTIGGYAYDIQEIGNSPQIVDGNDPRPGGIITIQIKYRHHNTDPFIRI